jgi:hypothetical protein
MSEYGFYLDRARKASEMVSEMEAAVVRNPTDRGFRANLASALKLVARTEDELLSVAQREQVDVCRYRLVPVVVNEFAVRGVSRSLDTFQEMFSHIYDALIRGPRSRAGLPPERRQETTLEFGYTFSGSLGVVLVMPGQMSLFEAKFDRVLDTINLVFDIQDDEGLRNEAKKIGRAAIQKVFEWSQANTGAGFEIDLRWVTPGSLEKGRYIERKQFSRVAAIIERTIDSDITPFAATGTLVGINSKIGTFHFVVPDGDSYKGYLEDGFPATKEWAINHVYDAVIVTETTIRFATGEESRRYRLRSLNPL